MKRIRAVNKYYIIGLVVLSVALILFFWLTNSFTMFEVQEETLASYSISGKNFKIEIKRVAAGATTSDVIQIRKIYSEGKFEVLKSIDGYSDLISSNVIADSVLRIIVKDSGYANNSPDTLEVKFR